ncbi:MAG: radical SAM protein [Spirochaetota bacterium]
MQLLPGYLQLYRSGRLEKIAGSLLDIGECCSICPHNCGVDRTRTKTGFCRSSLVPVVSSFQSHFGEESPLVGRHGSGTIFFTHCNMRCIFCQNYEISHLGCGREVSYDDLALMMLTLQERGCHNINFVTPTHMVYAIVKALLLAVPKGLKVPLVYNSGGYDSADTLTLLEGVFDIYMPDIKYADSLRGFELSGIEGYAEAAKSAVREMHRQVGDLKLDKRGIAYRGLLIRHLVLPNDCAGTNRVIDFIVQISTNTYLNLMDQFRPVYRAEEHPALRRRVGLKEYDDALEYAHRQGLSRAGRG